MHNYPGSVLMSSPRPRRVGIKIPKSNTTPAQQCYHHQGYTHLLASSPILTSPPYNHHRAHSSPGLFSFAVPRVDIVLLVVSLVLVLAPGPGGLG